MVGKGQIPENNPEDFKPKKKPGENSDTPENREKTAKEKLENRTHAELNNLRDSFEKTHANEALDTIDWLGKNSGVTPKKSQSDTSGIFETPVDNHVTYVSDIFGYDSIRSVAVLGKDLLVDTARLALHPIREIRNTIDSWK